MGNRIFGLVAFLCLAILVIWMGHVPARHDLRHELAALTRVSPPGQYMDMEMRTDSGVILNVSGKIKDPAQKASMQAGFQRAYDEKQKIDVFYRGSKVYEARAGNDIIMSYDIHLKNQKVLWFCSAVFVAMAFIAFFYKDRRES